MNFPNASILAGHVVLDELARAGVRHVFITPGSRSTPLVIAAAKHPDIHDHSVLDERSAAFAALGVGLATGRPAALICTSGTAVANYLPAVCEADLARVPLVMVTADRPPNLQDAGASQAMSQAGIFGDKVRWTCELGLPEADDDWLSHARARAARAVHAATSQAGPVHLNMAFRKPLEETSLDDDHRDAVADSVARSAAALGRPAGRSWAQFSARTDRVHLPDGLRELLATARHPVILAGAPASAPWNVSEYRASAERLAEQLGAPLLAEAASGLRSGAGSDHVIEGDLVLSDSEFVEQVPVDLVIQLGRWPINWPVQTWLRSVVAPIAVVSPGPADPEHAASFVVESELLPAIEAMLEVERDPADASAWLERARLLRQALASRDLSERALDGAVVRAVLGWGEPVFVSSSMPLRDLETFMSTNDDSSVFANRGLNGIDGVISTAAGVSVALGQRVQVVIGDVAYAHDLTGLVTAKRVGAELQVNVVDNGGGRIFDYLPVARADAKLFEKHFTTEPRFELVAAAAALGCTARSAQLSAAGDQCGAAGVVVYANRGSDPTRKRELIEEVVASVRGSSVPPVTGGTVAQNALVLLHGFTGDASTWSAFERSFGGETFAIDLLGHGGRSLGCRPTIEAMVDDVVSQLDRAGLQQVDLFGYSMGGRVAMAVAARAPQRVRTLVTLGSHPGLEHAAERSARRDHDWALADRLERDGLPAFLEFWMGLPIFASQQKLGEEWAQASIEQRLRGSARNYAEVLRWSGTGAQAPLWAALERFSGEHLALAGELDEKYAEIAAELERRTGAQAQIVTGAGHAAHYESPAAVADFVRRFLAEQQQSREAS